MTNAFTLKGIGFRSGTPYNTTLELTKQSDGTWHATKFGDVMRDTYSASKSGASQSCDTYEGETAVRTKLSNQEIAALGGKYDPHHMTRDQYDAFLEELIEKGALSRFDAMRLGHHGAHILDIDPEEFATGGIGCGTACIVGDGLKQSLEDADGDLMVWLESMLAQQDQGSDGMKALNTLFDIVKRM